MKKFSAIVLFIGGVLLMTTLSSCSTNNKEELEGAFSKILSIYPTENLMDFYDMEGAKTTDFSEDDKGTWRLNSSMNIKKDKNHSLFTEGARLWIDRNTKKAKGYYYISETKTNKEGKYPKMDEVEYPIIYDEKGIHLVEDIEDKELQKKIENFKFFVQYGNFKTLSSYDNIRKVYNKNSPFYELEYQLTNEDENVKKLREIYDIPTDKAPTLTLSGDGKPNNDLIDYKNITFQFTKDSAIFYEDSIGFVASKAN